MRDIRDAAISKLNRRMLSIKELKDHLLEKGYEEGGVDELVEEFLSIGYLNDVNYGVSYIRYGKGKGWGKQRIVRELKKRGLSENNIEDAFLDYYETENSEIGPGVGLNGADDQGDDKDRELLDAIKVAKKIIKIRDVENGYLDEKIKARVARRLYSYGYPSNIIYSAINEATKEITAEEDN